MGSRGILTCHFAGLYLFRFPFALMAMIRCTAFDCLDDAASTVAPSLSDSLDDLDTESVVSLSLESPCGSSKSSTCPLTDNMLSSHNHSPGPVCTLTVVQPVFVPCVWAIAVPGYANASPASLQTSTSTQSTNEACIKKQRVACDTRWCAKKQRAFPVHSMPAASEDEWQTRESKRHAAIDLVKHTEDYCRCLASACQLPVAPDAADRSISKRSWEVKVMKFRDSVKALAKTLESPVQSVIVTTSGSRPRWADVYDDEDEQ